MPYIPDLNTYLHTASLLITAYPNTRITTKYSLPRKPNSRSKTDTPSKRSLKTTNQPNREKKEPSAVLVIKTYHADSGICLKYQTDKAQEVGRLIAGLGRLARGEVIEVPVSTSAQVEGDAMDIDAGAVKVEEKVSMAQQTQQTQQQGGGGGGKKKKKGKK